MTLEDIDLKVALSSYEIYVRVEHNIIKRLRRSISVYGVSYEFSRRTPRGNMTYLIKSDNSDEIYLSMYDMGEFITFGGDISDRFIFITELNSDLYLELYTRFKI